MSSENEMKDSYEACGATIFVDGEPSGQRCTLDYRHNNDAQSAIAAHNIETKPSSK